MYVKRGRGRGRPPLASIDDSVVGVGIKSNIVIGISNDDDDDDCGGDDEVIDCSTGNVVGMIGDYVSSVLSLYKKDFGNIEFITGDNASVNKRLCDLMSLWINERGDRRKISLVGCACHRFTRNSQLLFN